MKGYTGCIERDVFIDGSRKMQIIKIFLEMVMVVVKKKRRTMDIKGGE